MDLMAFMETMGTSDIPVMAAFFIGLMTAISPCPLTTNIAAIAYVSNRIDDNRHTLLVGFLYTFGRMIAYISLASLIVWAGLSTQSISLFLQGHGEKILGPLLVVIGVLMFDILKIKFPTGSETMSRFKEDISRRGYLGGFLLGIVFALAFCPFSAVLFFGMLIPICLIAGDSLILPSVFAIATGLPVIFFSFLLVYSVSRVGTMVNKVQTFEKWMRKAVSITFICVGLYYTYLMFL
jgi:cytochrome c-type biogenesis protein